MIATNQTFTINTGLMYQAFASGSNSLYISLKRPNCFMAYASAVVSLPSTIAGSLMNISVIPSISTIQAIASYTFSFTTTNLLSEGAALLITFSGGIIPSLYNCSINISAGLTPAATCFASSSTQITISNLASNMTIYGGTTIIFSIDYIQNP